ncbi:hypothetical protein DUI87_27687 [Hirundo rustica rustica]|uniref:Octapeptide-repeat protein T2 n=1 Tax=Hirundo rustica rustica TaxID=333673 RepID=A0A3M0J3C8_HIRRU|nr:hypothetical protein DUI87_27687 [Hirundo rustica rustica]
MPQGMNKHLGQARANPEIPKLSGGAAGSLLLAQLELLDAQEEKQTGEVVEEGGPCFSSCSLVAQEARGTDLQLVHKLTMAHGAPSDIQLAQGHGAWIPGRPMALCDSTCNKESLGRALSLQALRCPWTPEPFRVRPETGEERRGEERRGEERRGERRGEERRGEERGEERRGEERRGEERRGEERRGEERRGEERRGEERRGEERRGEERRGRKEL